MAFYTSGLPSVAAATTDLWPSIANTLIVPWRAAHWSSPATKSKSQSQRRNASTASVRSGSASATQPGVADDAAKALSAIGPPIADVTTELPDFLRDAVLPQSLVRALSATPPPSLNINTLSELLNTSPRSLVMASPLFRRSHAALMSPRPLGSLPGLRFMSSYQPSRVQPFRWATERPLSRVSSRSFGSDSYTPSRTMLARLEKMANSDVNDSRAQNMFYDSLLKARRPAIVIERYQSGRFAADEKSAEFYHAASRMMGGGPIAGAQAETSVHPSGLSPTEIQAVGQAVAAQRTGANIAVSSKGVGTKSGPLHVVVDETISSSIFRWLKFFFWFGLATYISLVAITMAVEGMTSIKRPGGKFDSPEAKPENQKARFADVHGCDEAKEELQELVDFLRNPDKFSNLGGRLPTGVLLVGPPGTGKTLLARAVAGEAGVPFFFMSGSEFEEIYVGVGAKRVRELFAAAKAKAPSIVFIDELDAIGGRRNSRDASYARQTLNQLLTEMDGFEQNSGVIILGATNFPESLDHALTRPGRFDRHVVVSLPDVRGRIAILKHHAKKIKAAADVNMEAIASRTPGLSGADLENIVNQAAIHASKMKAQAVTQKDFDWAKDKVLMGAERKSMVISPKEKEMTAYHEAGHALVAYFARDPASELYKVTILPRGQSLGHTSFLPEMDKHSMSVRDYMGAIDRAMGGKVAEEIVYGNELVTSGVSAVSKPRLHLPY
ncbi:P-loop containing nucleoside triphosphate hydrolase protein [Lasiosphaeria miniovina]|uniref:P-loop containing nucleoside triphosphate hydrolase protein n=1 Tax=Lasiosphaeria miniovina TaxID=1954250 RepID=A0AA40A0E8_9PEZI|nr:P-loop containing nucleoside triphosphate hydrolase protein [Lasiosphaeria miniovina]KAK0706977.1 P-loop containing nucleoside triphosphate hydrolase protein [Lasiosphaeria miniovina]